MNNNKRDLYIFTALAPTSSKITTQYLVLDHMNNHYRKIVGAKCKFNVYSSNSTVKPD